MNLKRVKTAIDTLVEEFSKNNLGDPFRDVRLREALLADHLNHVLAPVGYPYDAFLKEETYEYKTISATRSARYDVSWCETWQKQKKYLREVKILPHKYHYLAKFSDRMEIEKIWRMTGEQALKILEPKLKKKFHQTTINKNGVLQAVITTNEFSVYGQQIFPAPTTLEMFF